MSTGTAVILVAGMGTRLAPLTDDRPKALVDLSGETILHRAVRLLREHGVRRVILATGYRQDAIEAACADLGVETVIVPNERYDSTQNAVSLALCAEAVNGEGFFKLDGDVVFQADVLRRLEQASAALAVAVDGTRRLDEEAMKVTAAGRRISAFGKGLSLEQSAGESIGIERLSAEAAEVVFSELEAQCSKGRTDRYYEDVYSDLIEGGRLEAELVEVGDLPWGEVDDLADLAAVREILRRA